MRLPRAQTLLAVCLGLGSIGVGSPARAQAIDLSYKKEVSWHVTGVPELAPMQATVRKVMDGAHVLYGGVEGQTIEGFHPGPTYSYDPFSGRAPFYIYIRDTATDLPMSRYYYGPQALLSTVEEFLRLQYPDGSVSATIGPDFKVDKATVVSDEETSAIVAAIQAYDALPDPAWLNQPIRNQPLVDRLNRAMEWVLTQRRDAQTGLIKRAHTTDWGDIKWESYTEPSDMRPGDQWTVSIYDQAIAYAALQGLARLNAATGRDQLRARWQGEAIEVRAQTNAVLWMDGPDRGYYRMHQHLAPNNVHHELNEDDVVAIGNAAAIYYGLAEPDKIDRILAALERARLEAGASKPGLTLYPAITGWLQVQMDPRTYQNGALWDWWAGRQISAEFWSGYWNLAREHLFMVARDWSTHPGQVREWESPWIRRNGQDQAYVGAAAVVGQAIVEGLFGVEMVGREVRLAPRLDDLSGGVRVYQPATDIYVAYEYNATERGESMEYGTNSPTALSVRLPIRWRGLTRARLDDTDWLPIAYERLGEAVVGEVIVPSGTHRVEFLQIETGRAHF